MIDPSAFSTRLHPLGSILNPIHTCLTEITQLDDGAKQVTVPLLQTALAPIRMASEVGHGAMAF